MTLLEQIYRHEKKELSKVLITLNAEELANWRWKMSIPMQATILSEEEVAEECQKHKDLLKKQLEAE